MSQNTFEFCNSRKITLAEISNLIDDSEIRISISDHAKRDVQKCHDYIRHKLENFSGAIYGINTGFGFLANEKINTEDLSQLQINLIRSHACGTGAELRPEIVRLMLLLKVPALAKGHSGVSLELIERIIAFYNEGIVPVVYEQGSLGASGDLAPLAHLFLPLIGEGEVDYKGKRMTGSELHQHMGWKPIQLGPKEGIALLNGTQFMLAHGVFLLHQTNRLSKFSDLIAALSLEGFNGRLDAFDPLIHKVRPHAGQIETAAFIYSVSGAEEAAKRPRKQVQDPYSFRCIPQVHGASKDTFRHVAGVMETEMNSVSDNPLIFPDEDKVISGGNFHGQPLAIALDMHAIALAELGSISERRTFLLLSGVNDLPLFLCKNPGLESGLMILQYTAASIASQNKQFCSPAVVDSITSSNGQEDHVSMGANAAVKAIKVLENLESILAIELICANQAIWLRSSTPFSESLTKIFLKHQKVIPPIKNDRIFSTDIQNSRDFIKKHRF